MMGNVLRLEDRRMAAIMTPVGDVVWLNLLAPHSQLPVCNGDMQQVVDVDRNRVDQVLASRVVPEAHLERRRPACFVGLI